MRWLDKPVRYAGSDLQKSARERGVVGVIADRAQIYCLDCAEQNAKLNVIGEIYAGSQQFAENLCDGCNAALTPEDAPPLMMMQSGQGEA